MAMSPSGPSTIRVQVPLAVFSVNHLGLFPAAVVVIDLGHHFGQLLGPSA
jgi:hypothetical protein